MGIGIRTRRFNGILTKTGIALSGARFCLSRGEFLNLFQSSITIHEKSACENLAGRRTHIRIRPPRLKTCGDWFKVVEGSRQT